MKLAFLLFVIAIFALANPSQAAPDKVVCYFGSWATYRSGNGRFTVEDIDYNKCTHVIYTFIGLNTDGTIKILDTYNEVNLNALKRFTDLKLKNPNLKTLIAIGGWNEGSVTYSNVAADANKRSTLVNSAINFMKQYNFDGFDIDWEYPAQRGGSSADKQNYISLLKLFREKFDASGKKYILSAAVAAPKSLATISYNIPEMDKYLDFINLMTYDLHGAYDGVTGQNAPLYASPTVDNTAAKQELNVAYIVNWWISQGASPNKLILGVAIYGRSFTLASSSYNRLGSPVTSVGNPGPYTQEAGFMGYLEICETIKAGGWTEVFDLDQKNPYITKGNQWIGYDNTKSITEKVNFAKSKNLGGIMIWSIETEDHKGVCGSKYPLLTAIVNTLGSSSSTTTTTTTTTTTAKPSSTTTTTTTKAPTTTTTKASTTTTTTTTKPSTTTTAAPSGGTTTCTKEGYIRDVNNCSKFYYCQRDGYGGFNMLPFTCPKGLVYDLVSSSCNYPYLVQC